MQNNKEKQLILLFDLTRHGLAHQYQQILGNLNDGKKFFIILTGAEFGQGLSRVRRASTSIDHLCYVFDEEGDLGLKVHPEYEYF